MSYFDTQDFLNAVDRFDEKLTKISDSLEVIAGCMKEMNDSRKKGTGPDPEKEKVISAFQAYVNQDAEAAEGSYVKQVLMYTCGLTHSDMKRYGFGWLLDDGEDAKASSALDKHVVS